MLLGVFVFCCGVYGNGGFGFNDMGEANFLEYLINARHRDVVRKLSHKNRWHQCHAAREVENGIEVVLLDVDGVYGTYLETISAVDTAVAKQHGFAVANPQRLGGARFHAVRTADAGIVVDAKGVKE